MAFAELVNQGDRFRIRVEGVGNAFKRCDFASQAQSKVDLLNEYADEIFENSKRLPIICGSTEFGVDTEIPIECFISTYDKSDLRQSVNATIVKIQQRAAQIQQALERYRED